METFQKYFNAVIEFIIFNVVAGIIPWLDFLWISNKDYLISNGGNFSMWIMMSILFSIASVCVVVNVFLYSIKEYADTVSRRS